MRRPSSPIHSFVVLRSGLTVLFWNSLLSPRGSLPVSRTFLRFVVDSGDSDGWIQSNRYPVEPRRHAEHLALNLEARSFVRRSAGKIEILPDFSLPFIFCPNLAPCPSKRKRASSLKQMKLSGSSPLGIKHMHPMSCLIQSLILPTPYSGAGDFLCGCLKRN